MIRVVLLIYNFTCPNKAHVGCIDSKFHVFWSFYFASRPLSDDVNTDIICITANVICVSTFLGDVILRY